MRAKGAPPPPPVQAGAGENWTKLCMPKAPLFFARPALRLPLRPPRARRRGAWQCTLPQRERAGRAAAGGTGRGNRSANCSLQVLSPAGRGTYFRVVFPFAGALGLRGQRAVPSARYETPALCARLPRRRSARLVVRLTWPRTSAPNAAASAPRSSAARALGGEPRHQCICAAVVRPAIMGFQRGCARVCSRSEGGGLTGRARDSPPVRLVRAPEP